MRWVCGTVALLLTALALAGCAEKEAAPASSDITIEGSGENGAPAPGTDTGTAPAEAAKATNTTGKQPNTTEETPLEPLVPSLKANVTEGTVPFDVTFEFTVDDPGREGLSWTFDADGDGELESEGTSLPFSFIFTFTEPGAHSATFRVEDNGEELVETVMVTALEAADFEAGESGGTTTGAAAATITALTSRAPFTLTKEHATLELVVVSSDPAAGAGVEYSIRLYDPNGGETSARTTNGAVTTFTDLVPGDYELNVWPASAGSYSFTVDYCAYTKTPCE